jgi:hypothetical protein
MMLLAQRSDDRSLLAFNRLGRLKGSTENEKFQPCSDLQKTTYAAKGLTKLLIKITEKGSNSLR